MNYFVFKSKFYENKYPIYVISNEDPRLEKDWEDKNYERYFIGVFSNYQTALNSIENFEPEFSKWEELDDSYLQGETVFIRS